MGVLAGFHHVKLPVTDVERSSAWYQRVLGLTLEIDFVEDGVLMGVALGNADNSVGLALRQDAARAAALSGFDPVALAVPTLFELEHWRDQLDLLGEPHGGIVTGHIGWAIVGLHDPDGIEIRLYTLEKHDAEASR
jgi:catechol 2,3-dioxygenase-like lactoylglutathione lyase family enzyme